MSRDMIKTLAVQLTRTQTCFKAFNKPNAMDILTEHILNITDVSNTHNLQMHTK